MDQSGGSIGVLGASLANRRHQNTKSLEHAQAKQSKESNEGMSVSEERMRMRMMKTDKT